MVVFVCLSSSAVYLEIATDYSTEVFLAANQRFTIRRGLCENHTSDCGTNFLGADKELRSLFEASSTQQVSEVPPQTRYRRHRAHLRRILHVALADQSALSHDPTDLSALTPGHFLIGTALNTIPEPSLIDRPSSRLSRWQLIRQMIERLWQ